MTVREIQQAITEGRWHELSLQQLRDELAYTERLQEYLRHMPQVDIVTRELSRLVTLEEAIRFIITGIEEVIRNSPYTPNV